MGKSDKIIYDPIHGFIGLTEKEVKIINTLPFQRLHHIRQLGPSYLVYPNAQHTRFAHSLGVLSVMGRFGQKLVEIGAVSAEQLRTLRLAALLHDIGHYPFSHTIEHTKLKGHSKFPKHENMAEHVMSNSDISHLLSDDEIDAIQRIITGKSDNPCFRYLLSSDIDVDRTDYLLRDAHHTGVTYGGIDIHRLAESIDFDGSCVTFLEKGIQAVENFLLSRYHMYQSVYHHKVVVAFDLLLKRIHRLLVEAKKVNDCQRIKKLRNFQWYNYNDSYIISKIKNAISQKNVLGLMATDFVKRNPLKLVAKQTDDNEITNGDRFREFRKLSAESKLVELAEESKIDIEWLFYTELEIDFIETQPEKYPTMIKPKYLGGMSDAILPLYDLRPLLVDMSSIELRLYTRIEYHDDVQAAMENFLS